MDFWLLLFNPENFIENSKAIDMVFSTGWNKFSTSIDFTFFIFISKTNCFPLKINYFHHYLSAIKSAKLIHSILGFLKRRKLI